jgi:hypothetical protein
VARASGIQGIAEAAILDPSTTADNNLLMVVHVAILASIFVLALETTHCLIEDQYIILQFICFLLLIIFTSLYIKEI